MPTKSSIVKNPAVPKFGRRSTTLEQARQLYVYAVVQGMRQADAYKLVFPHRKASAHNACSLASSILRQYQTEYAEDAAEAAKRAGIDADRYYRKLDKLLDAKMLDEKVETQIIEVESGRVQTVQTRNSIEVDDNGTQLGAVREVGRALGIGAQEGQSITQTNIQVVLVDGGIKKQRQRRIALEEEA